MSFKLRRVEFDFEFRVTRSFCGRNVFWRNLSADFEHYIYALKCRPNPDPNPNHNPNPNRIPNRTSLHRVESRLTWRKSSNSKLNSKLDTRCFWTLAAGSSERVSPSIIPTLVAWPSVSGAGQKSDERWAGVGKTSGAERELAERERSGERAESAAYGRSSLLSSVQSVLWEYRLYRGHYSALCCGNPMTFSPRDAHSASAVLLSSVVRSSCISVCPSVWNVDVPWAYRLEYEINYTSNWGVSRLPTLGLREAKQLSAIFYHCMLSRKGPILYV